MIAIILPEEGLCAVPKTRSVVLVDAGGAACGVYAAFPNTAVLQGDAAARRSDRCAVHVFADD